jgi:hypothetical protein
VNTRLFPAVSVSVSEEVETGRGATIWVSLFFAGLVIGGMLATSVLRDGSVAAIFRLVGLVASLAGFMTLLSRETIPASSWVFFGLYVVPWLLLVIRS